MRNWSFHFNILYYFQKWYQHDFLSSVERITFFTGCFSLLMSIDCRGVNLQIDRKRAITANYLGMNSCFWWPHFNFVGNKVKVSLLYSRQQQPIWTYISDQRLKQFQFIHVLLLDFDLNMYDIKNLKVRSAGSDWRSKYLIIQFYISKFISPSFTYKGTCTITFLLYIYCL